MAAGFSIRRAGPGDAGAIAGLIHRSTNTWYREHLNREIFSGDPTACRIFPEVYETLDPGCCLIAVDEADGSLCGSCFFHPRETHWSLGIMNAMPGSKGVAKALLAEIVRLAEAATLPLRLVSSAMNLDSFSLYSRAGFSPVRVYQDLSLAVPANGLDPGLRPGRASRVREATLADLEAIVGLELEISGLKREKDHRFFLENRQGFWSTRVIDSDPGNGLDGFFTSIAHPGSRLLGPGVARDEETALALIWELLDRCHRGSSPVWLVPVDATGMVRACYDWGARNCELHLAQVRGDGPPQERGLRFPTFMPETG